MYGRYLKSLISAFVIAFCMAGCIFLGQSMTAYASGSVELYSEGELKGSYDDLMSAFGQMTDASASYDIRLTDDSQTYEVNEDYTWPAVERISIQGPAGDSFAFVVLRGENTLQGDLELKGVAVQFATEDENPEFCMNIQNHTLYINGDVHISGETSKINLITGVYSTEIVGEVIGGEASKIVIDGCPELFCDLTVNEMILKGTVDFRGGNSKSTINRLECYPYSGVNINSIFYIEQSGGGVHVSIGSCFLHGIDWEPTGQSFLFDIGTNGSTLEIGDLVFEQEVGLQLGFNLGNMYQTVKSVEISLNGKLENICGIQVQYNQPISTYRAYKEEFALDKLFTAPNYEGDAWGYYHAFCQDIGEWEYSGTFDVKRIGNSYYVDRDSIYLEEPNEDENVEIRSGAWLYTLTEENTADITGYIDMGEDVVQIPETIDGYTVEKVTRLGRTIYDEKGLEHSSLEGVREVIIPASATQVSAHAFMLHELFGDITVLEKLTVAEGNPAYKSVGGVLYSADGETVVAVPQAIKSMEILEGTKWIEEYAFYRCLHLKKLYIPDTVVGIAGGSLRECDGLVDLRLPQGIEDISWSVGVGSDSLKRLYIPKLKKCTMACADTHGFGSDVFTYCANLDEVVFLDEQIKLKEGCTGIFQNCAPDLIAYCIAGSQTETLLKELGFRTKSLEELAVIRMYDEEIVLGRGEKHQNYLLRNPYDNAYFGSPILWTSSDVSVATVDANGLITAVGFGEATISATCNGATVSAKVTVPMTKEQLLKAFVERLYEVALDRAADEEGLNNWVNELQNGTKTGAEVAFNFIFSNEFKEKNYCDEHYIMQLYKAFMGREYDEGGLNYWLSVFKAGSTREAVFNGFSQSAEFKGICENYGIELGEPIEEPLNGTIPTGPCVVDGKENGVVSFIKRLYKICLDRDADENGLSYWSGMLRRNECSGATAAYGFVFSEEFINKNHSDADYIEYLYQAFMGRASEPNGKAYWLERMASGEVTREDVFNGFAYSAEFVGICNGYGITAY